MISYSKKNQERARIFFLSRCTSLLCRPLAFPPPPVHSLTTDNVNRKDEKKKKLLTNYIRRHRISLFFSIITKIKKKTTFNQTLFPSKNHCCCHIFNLKFSVAISILFLKFIQISENLPSLHYLIGFHFQVRQSHSFFFAYKLLQFHPLIAEQTRTKEKKNSLNKLE